jgi:nucleoside-diphosphate-sugar epimerase
MKRLLITGASGFLGRHCLSALSNEDFDVHATSRRPPAASSTKPFSWHECDLLSRGASSKLLARLRPTHLLHLAWYAVPGSFWEAPQNHEWVRASKDLAEAFAENGGERLVGAGTCAEYGLHSGECAECSTPLNPESLYARCKATTQHDLAHVAKQSGISCAWARVFFLYGPYEDHRRVVPYVIRCLLSGREALCSNGDQLLDLLHAGDAASAFVAILSSDIQGPVNIGSGRGIRLNEALLEIARQTNGTELLRLGARPSPPAPERIWANIGLLTGRTAWRPAVDLAEGIRQTIEWWRQFPDGT